MQRDAPVACTVNRASTMQKGLSKTKEKDEYIMRC